MKIPDSSKIINLATLLGLVVVLFVIYKILASVGLISTPASRKAAADKLAARQQLLSSEYFSPTYFHDHLGEYTSIGQDASYAYADRIYEALGSISSITTDFDAIQGVFLSLNCKTNISEVAGGYAVNHSAYLNKDLSDGLSDNKCLELMNIINKLPNT